MTKPTPGPARLRIRLDVEVEIGDEAAFGDTVESVLLTYPAAPNSEQQREMARFRGDAAFAIESLLDVEFAVDELLGQLDGVHPIRADAVVLPPGDDAWPGSWAERGS